MQIRAGLKKVSFFILAKVTNMTFTRTKMAGMVFLFEESYFYNCKGGENLIVKERKKPIRLLFAEALFRRLRKGLQTQNFLYIRITLFCFNTEKVISPPTTL
ncbi:hypothetical protein SAMN04488577_0149 [Bacillus sp. cl95]|nr:hypothetical protein SAMN02799634_11416 [Bacillus sp. UNCCL13]SFQ91719.1 hypothetical protein SAMN04488577_0149 [Bacillus sp. cl95]